MFVQVNEDDIRNGKPNTNDSCAIVRALLRVSGQQCKVSYDRIENADGGRIVTPVECRVFIRNYDVPERRHVFCQPFYFEVPDGFLK